MSYKAFLPNLLPFEVKVDQMLQDIISKADLALGRLDGMSEVLPDVDFFIYMYIKKEATLSSQIEGTQATFSDLLKAESKIKDNEIHKDVDEILNYIKAMNYGLKRIETLPLSLRLIRELHEILLAGVRGKGKTPGEFRRSQNWIGGTTIQTASFIPPPYSELPMLLNNLENFLYDKRPIPVLVKIGLIHAQFEGIHPFLDGNGRIGRLLITFYLCQQNVLKKPLLYLSAFFKKHRQMYYDRLQRFHGHDEIEEWLKFFITGVIETAESAVNTSRNIVKVRELDMQKVMQMGRSVQNGILLLNGLYKRPLIRVNDIEKITGLSNPNALILLKKFTNAKILKETTGQKRNRNFAYESYIRLFDKL